MKSRINLVMFQRFVIAGIFILLFILMSFLSPVFLTVTNLTNVLRQVSMTVIAACGATLIMTSGGLDLSVGSVLALSGVVAAKLSSEGFPLLLSIILGILVGSVIGLLNGLLVVYFRITPVIATLGTMYIARGSAYLISEGVAIVAGLPESYKLPGRGYLGFVPIPVIIMIIISFIFFVIQSKTVIGRYSYAIGGNIETAILSGINVDAIRLLLYVLGGTLAGIAGIILSSRLASGQPNSGIGFEFDVIVAVILGGTSLSGGEGTVIGTILGALIVGVLSNGLNLLGVHTFYQYILSGAVLVLAVILDMALKGRGVNLKYLARLIRGR